MCEFLEERRLFSGPPLQVADGALTSTNAAATAVETSGGASLTADGATVPNGGSVTTTVTATNAGAGNGLDENTLAILEVVAPSTGTANNLQITVDGNTVGTVTSDGASTGLVAAILPGPSASVGIANVAGATVSGMDV